MSERIAIALACTECGSRNYRTTRRPDHAGQISLKKFCTTCGKHTTHVETK